MTIDSKGWNLYKDIMLVCKKVENKDNYYLAYVVNPKNKVQLENARRWAKGYIDNEVFEFTLDNSDFHMEILSSANNSSQGGKLSFWTCLFKKDNNKFEIGINAELLEKLIHYTTIINGQVQDTVCFCRHSGQVGVLTDKIPQYIEAKIVEQKKEKLASSKKTSNYKKGKVYESLTLSTLCLGEIEKKYEVKPIFKDILGQHIEAKPIIVKLDKPKLYKLCVDYPKYSNYNSMKEVLNNLSIENQWGNKEPDYYPLSDMKDKTPARIEKESNLILDDDLSDLANYINKCLNYFEKKMKEKDYMKSYWYGLYLDVVCISNNLPENQIISLEEYNKLYSEEMEQNIQKIKNRWGYIKEVQIKWV